MHRAVQSPTPTDVLDEVMGSLGPEDRSDRITGDDVGQEEDNDEYAEDGQPGQERATDKVRPHNLGGETGKPVPPPVGYSFETSEKLYVKASGEGSKPLTLLRIATCRTG